MSSMWRFMFMGVLVHLLLLSAVFDIYFVSPIHRGMTPHKPGGKPLAQRLVLFVADGLRAESLYGPRMKIRSPYLNHVVHRVGSWGVSHTQVPTESRPGHVAILAGFNEDPSAITRGWKSNPVDFDSVVNQSSNAWCWGSPDIVDIFNKDNLSHIHLKSYDAYMQDFSGKESTTLLDEWVFDEVKTFFKQQEQKYCSEFCESGNVIFLHLLGLDTAGHSFKPESPEYIRNIKLVDEGIEAVEKIFEEYFEDGQTAYIFTADHGMTNWGSHGDGSAHETEVPFIAWGAGILRNSTRQDIKQADIAALMASLIGINIPVNSLGVVPLNYLNASKAQKGHIIDANARQLSEQYLIKHYGLHANSFNWTFQPFTELSKDIFNEKLSDLSSLIASGRYDEAIQESYDFIELCQEGLKYYTTYYQNILLFFVTLGFLGWIVYLFISINDLGTKTYGLCERKVLRNLLYSAHLPLTVYIPFIIMICLFIFVGNVPSRYFIYCVFPVCTWFAVFKNFKQGLISFSVLYTFSTLELIHLGIIYFVGIELLISSFFDRTYLSFVLLYFVIQSLLEDRIRLKMEQYMLYIVGHAVLGLCPIIFTLQTEFSGVSLVLSWVLWCSFQYNLPFTNLYVTDKRIITYQFYILRIACLNNIMVHLTISYGFGLLYINQTLSWLLSIIAVIIPLFISNCMENRVTSAIVALMVPYSLMAIGYEHMFMFCLCQHMLNWFSAEYVMKYDDYHLPIYQTTTVFSRYYTDQHSVRRCFYLLTFIMLSYFGVGNTASMNSFDPLWVRCFVTVFSPFTMAGLILVKLIIPFLVVLCAFRGIMLVTMAQIRNTFLIILLFCDIMVIHFLYFVQNEGSWLEIGVSLSRFIVANITTIVLILLYQIAYAITTMPAKFMVKYMPMKLVRYLRKLGLLN